MMKKIILISIVLVFLNSLMFGANVIPLPDLLNPISISLNKNQIYITEGIHIYIYSKKDFSLTKKFGKEGEGPKEFKLLQPGGFPLIIDVQTGNIIVNSLSKISFFSKKGDYQREIKVAVGVFSGAYQSLGSGFAGIGFTQENKTLYRNIHLTDEKMGKVKDVYRIEHDFQQGKGLKAVPNPYAFQTYENKLFIAWENEFIIHIFDEKGTKLNTINQKYARLPITENHKKRVLEYYKTDPNTKLIYEALKDQMYFPKLFPAIRNMIIIDQKIYIQTSKQKENMAEFYILDLKGKLLKRLLLPVKEQNPILIYPYTITDGKIYQLIENIDEEEWELHINNIK